MALSLGAGLLVVAIAISFYGWGMVTAVTAGAIVIVWYLPRVETRVCLIKLVYGSGEEEVSAGCILSWIAPPRYRRPLAGHLPRRSDMGGGSGSRDPVVAMPALSDLH